jgi:hypothetical protein
VAGQFVFVTDISQANNQEFVHVPDSSVITPLQQRQQNEMHV